jgi:hypothetical protein
MEALPPKGGSAAAGERLNAKFAQYVAPARKARFER